MVSEQAKKSPKEVLEELQGLKEEDKGSKATSVVRESGLMSPRQTTEFIATVEAIVKNGGAAQKQQDALRQDLLYETLEAVLEKKIEAESKPEKYVRKISNKELMAALWVAQGVEQYGLGETIRKELFANAILPEVTNNIATTAEEAEKGLGNTLVSELRDKKILTPAQAAEFMALASARIENVGVKKGDKDRALQDMLSIPLETILEKRAEADKDKPITDAELGAAAWVATGVRFFGVGEDLRKSLFKEALESAQEKGKSGQDTWVEGLGGDAGRGRGARVPGG